MVAEFMGPLGEIYRFVRSAARLVVGEIRRGPAAFVEIVRSGVMALFGRSAVDRNRNSAVVVSVTTAESDAATELVDEPGRLGRIAGSFLAQLGLGLVRQGHVEDAAEVLGDGVARIPGHARLRAAAEVVAGEQRVLSGQWRPPPAASQSIDPLPGRILHVVGKSLPHTLAGYSVRTQSIVAAQGKVGLDPQVVSRIGFPWYVDAVPGGLVETVDGVVYHRIGGPDVPARWDDRLDANVAALVPVVEEVRPALLHAHSDFENALLALALRERFDLPVVYEVRGFWEETWLSGSPERRPEADRYRWRHEREVACATAADHVVTLADTMRRRLVADGVAAESITIVPNAVDVDVFHPTARDPELASGLGIGAGDVVVGYISSLVDYEGVDTLLEAADIMIRRGDPVHVLVVGDGAARPRLERLAAKLGLDERAHFTGRVPYERVLDYYGLIDVFVVPRRNDRVCRLVTPLKPFEAMATETALVVSGVEALRDIADASGAAVFRPEDAPDLATTLRPLVADASARATLGVRGREWVTAERTWAANAVRYLDVYERFGVVPDRG
jgi:glycosyltransferase involved in cell wall biosynthesis